MGPLQSNMMVLCFYHLLTRLKSHGVPGVRKVKEPPLCSGGLQEMTQISNCKHSDREFIYLLHCRVTAYYSAEEVFLSSIDKDVQILIIHADIAAETPRRQQVEANKHDWRELLLSYTVDDDWGTLIFKIKQGAGLLSAAAEKKSVKVTKQCSYSLFLSAWHPEGAVKAKVSWTRCYTNLLLIIMPSSHNKWRGKDQRKWWKIIGKVAFICKPSSLRCDFEGGKKQVSIYTE